MSDIYNIELLLFYGPGPDRNQEPPRLDILFGTLYPTLPQHTRNASFKRCFNVDLTFRRYNNVDLTFRRYTNVVETCKRRRVPLLFSKYKMSNFK